ncbi:MAG: prepilin-type N-terminal cleavage/methylation domain-containing protein [Patescibacteria group bacterium]
MAHIFSQVRRKFGFSLIEVIVVVSIIGALSIVAYVAAASFSESRNNSKRIADISTLKGALETMLVETKTLPDPTANRSYYLANGGYAHSQAGAYGVSSSFSEDILGKYTLADHPKDPKTGGFYSYGRNFESHPSYDIAAVISENGSNVTYLRGTSNGSVLPSLIKAYDQGGFVEDGKANLLPYNPYARELIGRIMTYTGTVSITPAKVLTASLVAGDEVHVNAGGLASIKLSDGSEITL